MRAGGVDRIVALQVQHACCEELGRHHCCGTGKKSGFDEYGIGIVLYFKVSAFSSVYLARTFLTICRARVGTSSLSSVRV